MPKASPSARTAALTLTRNRTYQFQVRAVDVAGNVGAWKPAGAFRLAVAQETTRALSFVRGTWSRTTSVSYDGGAARSTRTVGGDRAFHVHRHSFAWVAAKSPVRGVARVYVDGTFAGTVDTYRSTSAARLMVFTRTWSASTAATRSKSGRSGRLRGTSTPSGRRSADAFVILTPVATPRHAATRLPRRPRRPARAGRRRRHRVMRPDRRHGDGEDRRRHRRHRLDGRRQRLRERLGRGVTVTATTRPGARSATGPTRSPATTTT